MTTERSAQIEPDTKDWTWVLTRTCPDCGFDAGSVATGSIAGLVRDNASAWVEVLDDPRAGQRPAPTVWSPVEYACHVRDVHRVFAGRIEQMLTEDDPVFANWDQDEAALAGRYDTQAAAAVAPALAAAAEHVATVYDAVEDAAWQRPGRRSNGSVFTVASLGAYHLHDVIHHRWDVRWMMGG